MANEQSTKFQKQTKVGLKTKVYNAQIKYLQG